MARGYITLDEPCEAEFTEKRSKFTGRLFPVNSLEEAQSVLDGIKKQFWDATHNCSAIIIGERGEYTRCSDDGEPQGTAGIPMLEALKHTGLTNVLAVATRYFGGILLGTGGLARAYTKCVTLAAEQAKKIEMRPCTLVEAEVPFHLFGKVDSLFRTNGRTVKDTEYTACVRILAYVPEGDFASLKKQLAEATSGLVIPRECGHEYVKIYL